MEQKFSPIRQPFVLLLCAFAITVAADGVFAVEASRFGGEWLAWHLTALNFTPVVALAASVYLLRGRIGTFRRNWPIALFGLWLLMSISWSVSPGTSASACLSTVPLLVLMIALNERFPLRRRLTTLVGGIGFVLVVSVPIYYHYGPVVTQFQSGAWGNRNNLAHICALIFLLVPGLLTPSHKFSSIGFVIIGAFAVFWIRESHSRTPLVAVVFALTTAIVCWILFLFQSKPVGLIAASATLTIAWIVIGRRFAHLLRSQFEVRFAGGEKSFAERVRFWRALLHDVKDAPIFGFGHGQVMFQTNRKAIAWQESAALLDHPHNGFVDSLLDGGIVLLVLLIIVIVCAVLCCVRVSRVSPLRAAWLIGVVVGAVSLNLTEPDFLHSGRATLFVLCLVAGNRPLRRPAPPD